MNAVNAGEAPDSLAVKQGARLTWDFENGKDGWTHANSVSSLGSSGGCLRGTANGTDPYVHDPSMNLAIKGAKGVAVRIWFSASGPLQLYWGNEDGDYSGERVVSTNVPANQWTTVWFDLSGDPDWAGKTLSKIRLDPGQSGVSFAIEHVSILDRPPLSDLPYITQVTDFETGLEGWSNSGYVTGFKAEDGRLKGKSSGNDPFVFGPEISFADQGGVLVHIKSSHACDARLYWATTEGGFSPQRNVKVQLNGNNYWQLLKYDLRDHPEWAGKTITRLRLDPGGSSGITFEIDNITLVTPAALEDADGDLLTTVEEAIHGTDPAVRDSVPRRLTQEKWIGTSFYSTTALVISEAFLGKPSVRSYGTLEAGDLFADPQAPNYYATRHRGYLTAPTTGTYRFWVTGRSGAELSLSTSDSKYHKQRIAQLNPDAGTGYGVFSNSDNLWDVYTSQMSEEIHLVAGQKYYLEAIQTTGHVGNTHLSIAWARPGQDREILTTDHLESYQPTADDADDDYLPDAWESQYGLDPADSGLIDPARQGERGDFDLDGLSNREEYLLGTDPTNPDTDGDGLTDAAESRAYGTDPTISDAPSGLTLSSLDLTAHTTSSGPWTLTSQGLIGSSFRGSISWNFSVPSDGFWLLDVATTLLGDLYLNETVDVEVLINGVSLGESELVYGLDRNALLRVFTPYITAGSHTMELKINNLVTRRMVSIRHIDVVQPQGADLNQDGIPDWVAAQILGGNAVHSYEPTSRTSPAHLEGSARMRSLTTLNNTSVLAGLGQSHWFANLPLDENAPTSFNVLLEPGIEETGAISWQSTNVFSGETLTIRKGDSLKLIAQPLTGATGQSVTLTFGPSGWNGTIGASGTTQVQLASDQDHHIYTLTAAGTYKVRATRPNGNTALMTIVVKRADFSHVSKDLFANKNGTLHFSSSLITSSLYFEGGDNLYIKNPGTVNQGILTLQALPEKTGAFNMIARLHEDGPILGVQPINIIGLSDVIQNNSAFTFTSGDFPGYNIIRSPIVVSGLPEGASVVITIFRAGVTFLDGTTTLTLTSSDFVNDFYNLEFLFPDTMSGGYCHYIDIYDRNGEFLGRR